MNTPAPYDNASECTEVGAEAMGLDQILDHLIAIGQGAAAIPSIEFAVAELLAADVDGSDFELDDLIERLRAADQVPVAELVLGAVAHLSERPVALNGFGWNGVPFAPGYDATRWQHIEAAFQAPGAAPYGSQEGAIDERVVEYGWLADRIRQVHPRGEPVLDAGSVMNYSPVLGWWGRAALGPLSVVTLCYEGHAFVSDSVRYEFADLRTLPYRDDWFATVVSLSTLEHVGMDSSLYGSSTARGTDPEREMQSALDELARVLRPGGTLLVSVPVGRKEDRGWFRILDLEEIRRCCDHPRWEHASARFFRARENGWREVTAAEVEDAVYNGFPGRGEPRPGPAWVAAAEAVALLELRKPAAPRVAVPASTLSS